MGGQLRGRRPGNDDDQDDEQQRCEEYSAPGQMGLTLPWAKQRLLGFHLVRLYSLSSRVNNIPPTTISFFMHLLFDIGGIIFHSNDLSKEILCQMLRETIGGWSPGLSRSTGAAGSLHGP